MTNQNIHKRKPQQYQSDPYDKPKYPQEKPQQYQSDPYDKPNYPQEKTTTIPI